MDKAKLLARVERSAQKVLQKKYAYTHAKPAQKAKAKREWDAAITEYKNLKAQVGK